MLAIYILLQQTLICLFCSLFCSCSLWFCLFVSAACSSACWWQRGYRLMMVVALICLAEKYRANRMQHCRPEIGSSVDTIWHSDDLPSPPLPVDLSVRERPHGVGKGYKTRGGKL